MHVKMVPNSPALSSQFRFIKSER